MSDNKDLYFKLYGRVADLRDMLDEILLEFEEEYIESEEGQEDKKRPYS